MPTPSPHDREPERDAQLMAVALRLAERGLGQTWPNPAVGCVIARDGRIFGRGWTQPGGRPHAEVEALSRAGGQAFGATAYISLEPCAHYGRTPPCTMALLHAGIRRAVIAARDPDPRVDGRGLEQLRQAGVEVTVGVHRQKAEALNAGFFRRVRDGRPLVTLKLASSLDGRIATRTGQSQWITGEQARARGHWLRATHDAIMIGGGTALADDPVLTCRLPGLERRSPVRVVLDGRLRLLPTSRLATTAHEVPVWLFTRRPAAKTPGRALTGLGVEVIEAGARSDGRLDLGEVLGVLAARGITRVLVEGGAELAAALLRGRLVDRVVWFQAPMIIGGDGRPAVAGLGADTLAEAIALSQGQSAPVAGDTLHHYIVGADEGAPCSPGSSPTSGGSSRSPRTTAAG
jgi:diaminohydroxyphosphoribosylaminopyrimidine deaminase/5-amino-6-(5-phosphoribosylamino)uracil reductase